MNNPWVNLPDSAPYVLPCDRGNIDAHNLNRSRDHKHHIGGEAFPEPYLGNPEAPLILLSGNPGKYPRLDEISRPFYAPGHPLLATARKNLLHSPLPYPFWTLDPAFRGYPGHQWWSERLHFLADHFAGDWRFIASNIFAVEFFPYHTQNYKRFPIIESQKYSFHLVKEAISHGATVVVMRAKKEWIQQIPSLAHYPKMIVLSSYRKPYVSPGQCSQEQWQAICRAVKV